MNKETRRIYLEFIQDRIQSALEYLSQRHSYIGSAEEDLQAAQEKLELLLNEEKEEEKPV